MESTKIRFRLLGSDFDDNSFEVKAFSAFLENLGQLIEESNRVLNNNDAEIFVKVDSQFVPGSFEFLLTVNQFVTETVLPLLIGDNVNGIINASVLISCLFSQGKSLIGVIKKLKGQVPKKTEVKNGTAFIYEDDDTYFEMTTEGLALFKSPKVVNSIGNAIVSALSSKGANRLEILNENNQNFVSKDEVAYFERQMIEVDEVVGQDIVTTTLEIVSISFDPDKSWVFRNNNEQFTAEIICPDFLTKVGNGEVFKKGDLLDCTMKIVYYKTVQQTRKKRTILSVFSHHQPNHMMDQISFSDNSM